MQNETKQMLSKSDFCYVKMETLAELQKVTQKKIRKILSDGVARRNEFAM